MHIREKSRGLTCYFLFFSFFSPSPSNLPSPCPSFPFTHFVSACLGRELFKNIHPRQPSVMYYQTDSKVSQFFCIGPLVHFYHFLSPHIFSSISKFLLLFSSFSSLSPFPSLLLPFLLSFLFPSFSLFFDSLP